MSSSSDNMDSLSLIVPFKTFLNILEFLSQYYIIANTFEESILAIDDPQLHQFEKTFYEEEIEGDDINTKISFEETFFVGDKCFKAKINFLIFVRMYDDITYTDCNGDKCRREYHPYFSEYCRSCHTDYDNLSNREKLLVSFHWGKEFFNVNLYCGEGKCDEDNGSIICDSCADRTIYSMPLLSHVLQKESFTKICAYYLSDVREINPSEDYIDDWKKFLKNKIEVGSIAPGSVGYEDNSIIYTQYGFESHLQLMDFLS
jgi:hypothetical protein